MGRTPKFSDRDLLDRAMELCWQRGWSHTSIRDLEAALEVKAPAIYRRFGTKDEFGVAIVDHYVERVVRRRIERHLHGSGDPIENIVAFLELSVTQASDGEPLRGCLLTTTAQSVEAVDEMLRAALRRGFEVIEAGLRSEVERAAERGLLAPGLDPHDATSTLALVMQGLMAIARSDVDPQALQTRARVAVAAITAG